MTHADVLIVGAGPAGVRAAEILVSRGLRPLIIDESPKSGGQIYRQQPDALTRSADALYGFETKKAKRLQLAFERIREKIEYWPSSAVWAFEGKAAWVDRADGRQELVTFDRIVLATGAVDRVVPMEGWTVPGVYTLGAAQIALKYQACHVGRRVALLGTGPLLYLVAYQYKKTGADIAGIFDTAPSFQQILNLPRLAVVPMALLKGLYYVAWLRRQKVPIHTGVTPLRVEGRERVAGIAVRSSSGAVMHVECDGLAMGYHVQAETQLADILGCAFRFDSLSKQWLPVRDKLGRATVQGVYLAGDAAEVLGADTAEAGGALAAYACLQDMGYTLPTAALLSLTWKMRRGRWFAKGLRRAFPAPIHLPPGLSDSTIICRCEEVTVGEVRHACRALEAQESNRVKAFVRVGMGRCQARICGFAAIGVAAEAIGTEMALIGRLRGQAPIKPQCLDTGGSP